MRAPRRIVFFIGGLVVLAIVSALLFRRSSKPEPLESGTAGPVNVSTIRAVRGSISRELELASVFQPFQEVDIHGKVSGYIQKIYVDIGDRVRQGQLLAILEVPELRAQVQGADAGVARNQSDIERLQKEVARAQATYAAAHSNYQRLKSASEQQPGLIAEQELDDAASRDLAAEAQRDAAKSAVASAQQQLGISHAELERIHTLAQYATISAPFSGVVTARYADTGSLIPAGTSNTLNAQPVVRLAQSDVLRLRIPIPEQDVPLVREGASVHISVQATGQSFTGMVIRFSRDVSNSTRTMLTEIDVKNSDLKLTPGMYANATFTLQKKDNVLVVPVSAVLQSPRPRVWVVDRSGHAQPHSVSLGIVNANEQEIVSGINVGDQIIVGGQSALQTGQSVHATSAHIDLTNYQNASQEAH